MVDLNRREFQAGFAAFTAWIESSPANAILASQSDAPTKANQGEKGAKSEGSTKNSSDSKSSTSTTETTHRSRRTASAIEEYGSRISDEDGDADDPDAKSGSLKTKNEQMQVGSWEGRVVFLVFDGRVVLEVATDFNMRGMLDASEWSDKFRVGWEIAKFINIPSNDNARGAIREIAAYAGGAAAGAVILGGLTTVGVGVASAGAVAFMGAYATSEITGAIAAELVRDVNLTESGGRVPKGYAEFVRPTETIIRVLRYESARQAERAFDRASRALDHASSALSEIAQPKPSKRAL